MVRLSREDAQTLIYRGCARLAKAMQIKHIATDAAQEWEERVVKEAVRDQLFSLPTCPEVPFYLVIERSRQCSDAWSRDRSQDSTVATCIARGAKEAQQTTVDAAVRHPLTL